MLAQTQLWVVKVGSSLVTAEGRGVDAAALAQWARQIAQLRQEGKEIVLVSSGAIAEGLHRLDWNVRPHALNELQAAAAVGQMGLSQAYDASFASHGLKTAQVLLTHEDLSNRTRYLNARSTLRTLLHHQVVPVINENDTVTTDEIKLGDNDTLGALVANLIEADALLILTDQIGLFDADPRQHPNAKLIPEIAADHPELENMAGGAGSAIGTGGMLTKVRAARRAAQSGALTVVASGKEPDILLKIASGQDHGTRFLPRQSRLSARKRWLTGQIQLSGSLNVDEGAARALLMRHTSLLPIGCTGVSGHFRRGEVVAVRNPAGAEVARGLVNYSSEEILKILRQPSHQIENRLGYVAEEEVIHRDNMALSA